MKFSDLQVLALTLLLGREKAAVVRAQDGMDTPTTLPEGAPSRCETPGEIDPLTGQFCPGQAEVDAFVYAMNQWGTNAELETARQLWVQSDTETMLCIHPPGCFTGTDNIIMGLAFVGNYISHPYSYETNNDTWESGPGFLLLNDSKETFTSVGGCQYLSEFFQYLYYNEEGLVYQSHFVVIPTDPRSTWMAAALSRATCDCSLIEPLEGEVVGPEIFQSRDSGEVDMMIESTVDKDTCTYTIDLSFSPDLDIPYMADSAQVPATPTMADLKPSDAASYDALCFGEGLFEWQPLDFGSNEHYTEFVYTLELPENVKAASGFDHFTIGADPCGTIFQPYPHYGVHFYTVPESKREEMTCFSKGGSFCKSTCLGGDKFGTDGTGITTCDGTNAVPPAGEGTPANVPLNFVFTTDATVWLDEFQMFLQNAATPGIGMHALDMATLEPEVKPWDVPNMLSVQYDGEIVAHMVQFWTGFANGHTNEATWEMDGIEYNCQDTEKYGTLPTRHSASYDEATGRTHLTISGPVADCEGLESSFTETTDSTGATDPEESPPPEEDPTSGAGKLCNPLALLSVSALLWKMLL